jgi:tetratricopeptide (TPR) repeat protein
MALGHARPMSFAYQSGLKLSSQGRHGEAITQFEQALALEPDDPKVLFALGNTACQLGLSSAAEQFFRRVLTQEPCRTEAIVNLSNLLRASGQFDAAITLLAPAVSREPQNAEMQLTLGSTWRERGDLDRAKLHYQAALAARPEYGLALANLADLLCDEGQRDTARTLYDTALRAEPKNAQIRLNRAILHFLNGDLKEAWRDYAARIDVPGKVPALASEQRLAPWNGENLKKKRLLVRSEQGIGDQIMFASLIPELLQRVLNDDGSLVLECEPRLQTLFARSFRGVTVKPAVLKTVNGVAVADYGWLKSAGGVNTATLMGTLPRYMRGRIEDFPKPYSFLVPDPQETARWKETFGPGAIGICWRSGKLGGHRSIGFAPLESWGTFLRNTEATFVSVQYDARPEELAQLESMSGKKIVVPQGIDQKIELDRAASLMAALRLIVSAPTAVACISAALGIATLKLLYNLSWTAMGLDYEPFLPSCRCVMPRQAGDWADVFNQATQIIEQS